MCIDKQGRRAHRKSFERCVHLQTITPVTSRSWQGVRENPKLIMVSTGVVGQELRKTQWSKILSLAPMHL